MSSATKGHEPLSNQMIFLRRTVKQMELAYHNFPNRSLARLSHVLQDFLTQKIEFIYASPLISLQLY